MPVNVVQSSSATKVTQAAKVQLIKLITFDIGKLNLAIRIEQIHKVVNIPAVHGSGLSSTGLARVEGQDVTVVDLHRKLFRTDSAPASNYYLVLVKTQRGELLGIPASQTPLLMDLPATQIRSLPESYRRSDTLEIASHIAMLPTNAEPAELPSRPLFLLDVEMLAR